MTQKEAWKKDVHEKLGKWIEAGEIDEGVWIQGEILDLVASQRLAAVQEFVEKVKERIPEKDEGLWGIKGNFMIERFIHLLTEQLEEAQKFNS